MAIAKGRNGRHVDVDNMRICQHCGDAVVEEAGDFFHLNPDQCDRPVPIPLPFVTEG